ncbi:hypothetical protein BJY01DRAFT_173084 [Aspergillus pseudoustus]|uniref:MADS-box domain-containing protein n=1 Tax=Aspergillus pseudoustus TaxID=1810923 RepID=A0ABR4K606_9EURO
MAKAKIIRRRKSKKSKAKSQQRRRRGDTLFRKAFEFSQECDADVMLVFRLRKNGQTYIFNSNDRWFPSRDDLALTYPSPLRITSRELGAKYEEKMEVRDN